MSTNDPKDPTRPTGDSPMKLEPWAERLLQRSAASRGMPRRVFLKVSGVSGLALGWGCSSDGEQGAGGPAGQGSLTTDPSGTAPGVVPAGSGPGTGVAATDGPGPGIVGPPAGTGSVPGPNPGAGGGPGTTPSGAGGAPNPGPDGAGGGPDVPEPEGCVSDCECGPPSEEGPPPEAAPSSLVNAYVRIGTDDTVTLYCPKCEMGQGVMTALPMMIADELGVDWTKVRAEHPMPGSAYGDQSTFGSTSVANTFQAMRQMGAAAREMLIAAAAQNWGVSASECRVELGEIFHDGSGQSARFGEVAELAATMSAPQNPQLKSSGDYTIIGTPRAQLGAREKASGKAIYGIDVIIPDMVYGVVAFPPDIGGSVGSYDDAAALAVPGVRAVVEISAGVAVLADNTWAALKGRDALEVQWVAGPNANVNSETMSSNMMSMMGSGMASVDQGDALGAFDAAPAERALDVEYHLPYLAHAAMEPLNAVAYVNGGSVEVWAGTQVPGSAVTAAAQAAGVSEQNVTFHVPLLGGAFGRRASTDYITVAVEASRESGLPVKLMYTREDDTRAAQYRPLNANRLRGSVDASGNIESWSHDLVLQPVFFSAFAVEGAATNFYYDISNRRVTYTDPRQGVPVSTWRSVGASHNAFVVESFLDELAALGGQDPLALRLDLLANEGSGDAQRLSAVLQDVAMRAGWDTPPAEGRGRGIACHLTFGTAVAQVVEVSVVEGEVKIHKVWATVDCGFAVNPRGIEAQVEGSICFGLSAALHGEIKIENGGAVQDNFNTYRMVRMSDIPAIEVSIINSGATMTGMGEPAVSPIAPALCNAIFQASGQRVRKLPISLA